MTETFGFHRIVNRWFAARFAAPTPPQARGWPEIRAGHDTLIAAPTGSGKTLTAFLVCIDRLLREAILGQLTDTTRILYVSPLKALASDVHKNLEMPLAEIQAAAAQEGLDIPRIRAAQRSGDTPAHKRQAMLKKPPHILVTTPESLYLLLTGAKSRELLATVDTVIIDEIHAMALSKRGTHLALSLERLAALTGKRPQRIGLSATQKPIDEIAAFLVGGCSEAPRPPCQIIDSGHARALDLQVVVPASELGAVCSNEHWDEVYLKLKELILAHRSTLVFVNTRKLAERVAFSLAQHLGEDQVASHHGSLAKDRRLAAEEKLKAGELKAIVATASLELGIDVGAIDLVCQIGSPRSIATFLQRVGRAGHTVGATPKGRLFALTRDELLEALALIQAVHAGELDRIVIPEQPLDILAQQIVAEAATRELTEDELYTLVRCAYPYRDLTRAVFDEVVDMLAQGYARGARRIAYLHRDMVGGRLRARRGARLTALTSGGAIPEQGDFRVVTEEDGTLVGTVNEDFALESARGDVFLLGSTSWQIAQLRGTDLVVRDMQGAPPTIPFWLGEAPGRTPELSTALSGLRGQVEELIQLPTSGDDPLFHLDAIQAIRQLDPPAYRPARAWLEGALGADEWAALQAIHYIAAQKVALGLVPTQKRVVFERFFDDTGGMQLVIHAPFGMRINKGWGLALRKCFCRSFDFELQASADDDGIVLSLGPQHSFPIEQLFGMLNERNIQALLEQAILAVPLFQIRWRWNSTRSLAVLRQRNGKRVPPVLQRHRADDLMTAIFPAQTQCKEHLTGDIEIPDHPLVRQTMHDCLTEAIDLDGLLGLMQRIAKGDIELVARDTREPSPFSYQRLNAYPYAFLDGAPLEERRARAVAMRRSLGLDALSDLARLDPEAARLVAREAWPLARDADELHDALLAAGALPERTVLERTPEWQQPLTDLIRAGRAARCVSGDVTLWFAAEACDLVRAAYPNARIFPELNIPERCRRTWETEDARLTVLKGYLECRGVVTAAELASELGLGLTVVELSLPAIEVRGEVVRGRFTGETADVQWCERRLLIRLHRLTLDGLRRQVKPVTPEEFMAFLVRHQGLAAGRQRAERQGLLETLAQLQGFDAAAGSWETEILAARLEAYQSSWLDELTHAGVACWGRLRPPEAAEDAAPAQGGMTRTVPLALFLREDLSWLLPADRTAPLNLARANALAVYEALENHGAQFLTELKIRTKLLDTQLEEALGELCRLGLIHADGFAAIRPFVSRNKKKAADSVRKEGAARHFLLKTPTYALGGRWALFPGACQPDLGDEERVTAWAWLLLRRYGVVFRDLIRRETCAPAWSALARVYRLLEARGEIRGGRFVSGPFGEQFALAESIDELRRVRDEGATGDWVVISAADPLNLVGILTPGTRISSARAALLVLADGRHVATRDGTEIQFLVPQPAATQQAMTQALQLSGVFRGRLRAQLAPAMVGNGRGS